MHKYLTPNAVRRSSKRASCEKDTTRDIQAQIDKILAKPLPPPATPPRTPPRGWKAISWVGPPPHTLIEVTHKNVADEHVLVLRSFDDLLNRALVVVGCGTFRQSVLYISWDRGVPRVMGHISSTQGNHEWSMLRGVYRRLFVESVGVLLRIDGFDYRSSMVQMRTCSITTDDKTCGLFGKCTFTADFFGDVCTGTGDQLDVFDGMVCKTRPVHPIPTTRWKGSYLATWVDAKDEVVVVRANNISNPMSLGGPGLWVEVVRSSVYQGAFIWWTEAATYLRDAHREKKFQFYAPIDKDALDNQHEVTPFIFAMVMDVSVGGWIRSKDTVVEGVGGFTYPPKPERTWSPSVVRVYGGVATHQRGQEQAQDTCGDEDLPSLVDDALCISSGDDKDDCFRDLSPIPIPSPSTPTLAQEGGHDHGGDPLMPPPPPLMVPRIAFTVPLPPPSPRIIPVPYGPSSAEQVLRDRCLISNNPIYHNLLCDLKRK